MLESLHQGHAVICGPDGIVQAWGDPQAVIFPRSSCKMIQALPLIESGAAEAAGLSDAQLALACASHQGAHVHTDMVTGWPTWACRNPTCGAVRTCRPT
jgi:L-asparaginase II